MTRKHTQLTLSILAGFFLIVMLILSTTAMPGHDARADTVPTPVAIMNQSDQAALVTFLDGAAAISADAGSNGLQLYTYEYCNIQYIIDQVDGAVPNTTTLTLQWSMDNSTWSDGPNLVAANVADADSIVQMPNLGRYIRIYQDVTNTNNITITAKAVCK